MNRTIIFLKMTDERERQNKMHPEWKGDHHGLSVLMEEVGEVSRGLYEWTEAKDEDRKKYWKQNLKSELIQVASVCSRWLENLDD